MRVLNTVTLVLLIVGGLNWGLVGLFGFDLVAAIFGEMSALSRIVYTLVGVSVSSTETSKSKSWPCFNSTNAWYRVRM